MKKKIDETALMSELRRESSFFRDATAHEERDPMEPTGEAGAPAPQVELPPAHATVVTRAHEPMSPCYPDNLIDAIRKAVKAVGREDSTIRLTREEKMELRDIAYTFERQGQSISGNVLHRIALHFVLTDYREDGKESVLSRVVEALAS